MGKEKNKERGEGKLRRRGKKKGVGRRRGRGWKEKKGRREAMLFGHGLLVYGVRLRLSALSVKRTHGRPNFDLSIFLRSIP